MKKLSDKRKCKLIDATNKIYKKACDEVGWSRESLMMQSVAWPNERTLSEEQIEEFREQIDQRYCQYLSQLDTQILEDLLVGHRAGQIRRAARTLDIVSKELLERVLHENKQRDAD